MPQRPGRSGYPSAADHSFRFDSEGSSDGDLNAQLDDWLATVANVRLHGTTQRIVAEAFAAEKAELQSLPAVPFDELLRLDRRVSHDGLVSIGVTASLIGPGASSRCTSCRTRSAYWIRVGSLLRIRSWRGTGNTGSTLPIGTWRTRECHGRRPKTSSESVNASPIVRLPSIRRSANDLRSWEVGQCRRHYHRQHQK
jgi:hypothetical protein